MRTSDAKSSEILGYQRRWQCECQIIATTRLIASEIRNMGQDVKQISCHLWLFQQHKLSSSLSPIRAFIPFFDLPSLTFFRVSATLDSRCLVRPCRRRAKFPEEICGFCGEPAGSHKTPT